MARPALEVADILREHGSAWREANRGHVSLDQLKLMSAIERCRTAALGGHVARCENAARGHTLIAYNSCRNSHPMLTDSARRRTIRRMLAHRLRFPIALSLSLFACAASAPPTAAKRGPASVPA